MWDLILQGVLVGVGVALTFIAIGVIGILALFFVAREISDANDD